MTARGRDIGTTYYYIDTYVCSHNKIVVSDDTSDRPSTSIPSSSMLVLAVPTTNVPLAPSTNFPTFDNIIDDDDDRTVSEK
jgi:hypothetical protein